MPLQFIPPPTQHWTQQQRHHQKQRNRRRRLVEIRWPNRNLVAHRLGRQGVERADQNDGENDAQENIVGDNAAFAADDLERFTLLDGTNARRKNQKRKAGVHKHEHKNE